MQALVDQTYGGGHDVHGLYLNRYAPKPIAGHPNPDPTLEKPQGTVVRSIPLWQVLQTNMPTHTVFGNEYRGDGQEYKIVTAADRTKKHDDATGVLDPEKLYHALNNVDFQTEQTTAINGYYDQHGPDLAQLAKDKALTQLDVQYYTGGLDQHDYESIKNLLSGQGGGKIYTLSTGTHTLAGGFRIALDSGKNFLWLSQESQPYQAFKNEAEALQAIPAQGKDPDSAQTFIQKYSSLGGDPGLEHGTDAAKELHQRSGDGVKNQAFNGREVDSTQYDRLLRGTQFEITHDPFGELTRESRKNDLQDAKQGIRSNGDITAEGAKKWGGIAGQVLADTVGVFAPEMAGAKLGSGAELGETVADAQKAGPKETPLGGKVAEGEPDIRPVLADSSSTTKPVAGPGPRGNLSLVDEVAKTTPADQRLAAYDSGKTTKGLSPDKDGVYDIDGNTFVPLGKHTPDELKQGVRLYQMTRWQGYNRLIKPGGGIPDFNAPYVQQGENGAFTATRPGLKGGMEEQVPGPSQPQPSTSKAAQATQRFWTDDRISKDLQSTDINNPGIRRTDTIWRPWENGPEFYENPSTGQRYVKTNSGRFLRVSQDNHGLLRAFRRTDHDTARGPVLKWNDKEKLFHVSDAEFVYDEGNRYGAFFRYITGDGRPEIFHLSGREGAVFGRLLAKRGELVSFDELESLMVEIGYEPSGIRDNIASIKKKIKTHIPWATFDIEAVRGRGFKLTF